MAARCTGCWCTRTLERELPPVAERHGGSSRTAAAAVCQRAGGYGAGLGTLAAAAAALVMARGGSAGWTAVCFEMPDRASRCPVAASGARSEARPKRLRNMDAHSPRRTYIHDVAFSLRGATGGCRLKHALFRGPLAARAFADDARPSMSASRRDDCGGKDVLGFLRFAPDLSHLSSEVATQSSTTRAARRRSRDAPCLASAAAQAMASVIKNGQWWSGPGDRCAHISP